MAGSKKPETLRHALQHGLAEPAEFAYHDRWPNCEIRETWMATSACGLIILGGPVAVIASWNTANRVATLIMLVVLTLPLTYIMVFATRDWIAKMNDLKRGRDDVLAIVDGQFLVRSQGVERPATYLRHDRNLMRIVLEIDGHSQTYAAAHMLRRPQ